MRFNLDRKILVNMENFAFLLPFVAMFLFPPPPPPPPPLSPGIHQILHGEYSK